MTLKQEYPSVEKRKKVLLLCDDPRYSSGVGNMSREIITQSAHRINWVVLGGLTKHPDQGKRLDLSADVNSILGITDSYVHLIPYSGYGDSKILRTLLLSEKPDAIIIFTDPRYWIWLFEMEREIRNQVPIIYLNIWDNYPAPLYNKPYYESCDVLLAISKQTKNINEIVLGDKAEDKIIEYTPHGVGPDKYYPIEPSSEEYNELQSFRKQLNIPEDNFVVLWNSRNITRKQPSTVIEAFSKFVSRLQSTKRSKVTLIMHTDPIDPNGTDLFTVKQAIAGSDVDIRFSTDRLDVKRMNFLYNIADTTLLISSNEGWGLSITEALMAGKMVIGNVTGGIQDQMRFEDAEGSWITFDRNTVSMHRSKGSKCGKWAVPVYPSNISLIGSITTPYIYDDRCSATDVADALDYVYLLSKEARKERGLAGREWVLSEESKMSSRKMVDRIADIIEKGISKFKPRPRYEVIKVEDLPGKEIPHNLDY